LRPIVAILAICHRDAIAAQRWLKWASYLASKNGGDVSRKNLVVFVTHRVAAQGTEQFAESIIPSDNWFKTYYAVCPDEYEIGYPGSANHIFLRALEYCKKHFPAHDTLFIEPDCVPVDIDWFTAIEKEWGKHDKKFMGGLTESNHSHMTGNAVYDKDWPSAAPSILTVLDRKDSGGMFPNGLGFPFDLWIAGDVLKSFYRAETIFQVWAPGQWNKSNVNRIQTGAKLVHQDKTGSLVMTMARTKFPGFLDHMPAPSAFFLLQSPEHKFNVNGQVFEFTPCSRAPDGAWWSVFRPDDYEAEMILNSVSGKQGLQAISQDDYKALLSQRR
jgi:hypothetical protein